MTDKVSFAIEELHRDERHLVAELMHLSDRHHADHEIHHVARDLAGWSREHVRVLAELGAAHGLDLDREAGGASTLLAAARHKGSDLLGRHHGPALLLIRDLRALHRAAAGVSLDWDVLAQTAQALKDTDLFAAAQRCHPQTLRQMRWADATVKAVSAQALVTG